MSHYKTIQALGTPIVVHSGVTAMLGSTTASILLSHIMYWSDKTDNPLGFYRTLDELKAETSLTENELRTARKLLVNLGLVDEKYARLEHRLYFKFNVQIFDKLFGEHLAKYEKSDLAKREKHISPPVKFTNGEVQNPQIGNGENHSSLYTKITTKNTNKDYNKESESKNAHAHTSSVENLDCGFSDDEILAVANNHIEKNSDLEFNPIEFLTDNGVDLELANRFVKYKKSKLKCGEKITKTMLILVKNQAEKTGLISFADALKIILATGKWQGFNAEWAWQSWYEAVLITENRTIPDWLKSSQSTSQNPSNSTIAPMPVDKTSKVMLNGLYFDVFPNMTARQTHYFVKTNRDGCEMTDETYERLSQQMDWKNFDYKTFFEQFDEQQRTA